MKDKASWVLIVVSLIGALSANIQTILSTAGDRADKANANVKLIVTSLQEQMKYSDTQLTKIADKASQLSDQLGHQEEEIRELREMIFALTVRKGGGEAAKVELPVPAAADSDKATETKAPVSKPVSRVIVQAPQRPNWPPKLLD